MKTNLLTLIFVLSGFLLFGQNKYETSSELALNTPNGNVYGTLSVADSTQQTPVVIIIPGTGATDRDCNSLPRLHSNAFKFLSAELSKNGISSLRYDKRGVGKSMGTIKNEMELRFEDYVADVVSWISLLKDDERFSRVIVMGHSEGSLLGMIAAQQNKVESYISVAGVGETADLLLKEQLKQLPPQLLHESNKILDSLKMGKTVSNVNSNLFSFFRPSLQPYLISWIKYDPSVEITRLKIPVLLIQGNTDIQVGVKNIELLAKANPKAKVVIIDNMNHILKESTSDISENLGTYQKPELPIKADFMEEVIRFIKTK